MPSINYEDSLELRRAAGLINKNKVTALQQEQTREERADKWKQEHLEQADKHAAAIKDAQFSADAAKAAGDMPSYHHYKMLANSERTKEREERDLANRSQRNTYREPGHGQTQFIGMEVEEGYDNTRSMIQGWIDQENAIMEDQIRKCKASGHWNWKTGGAIHNGYWEGTRENGHVVSTLPKKTHSIEELTSKQD